MIDAKVIDGLVAARSRAASSPLAHLTPREVEILAEMAKGKNNATVATNLVLSERAVEKHISSIFRINGIEATRRITATHPDVVVLLVSTYDADDLPPDAATAGHAAYVNKDQLGPSVLQQVWAGRPATQGA